MIGRMLGLERMARLWPRFRRDTSGAVAVETALVLTLATTVGVALFEFSMCVYTYSVLFEAAHQGVRLAEVQGYDAGTKLSGCSTTAPSAVISKIQNVAASSFHDMRKMTVTICYPDTTGSKPLSRVQVTLGYTYVPIVQIPGLRMNMSAYSEGRIVY